MPEYRECWIHFKHVQHVFGEHPDHDWTVLRLWANLTEKESPEGASRSLETLRADCRLTRGGGNKRRPETGIQPETGSPTDLEVEMVQVHADHAHLPLWPPQLRSEDRCEEFATKALSGLRLRGFRSSPRAVVADFGSLLMQVSVPSLSSGYFGRLIPSVSVLHALVGPVLPIGQMAQEFRWFLCQGSSLAIIVHRLHKRDVIRSRSVASASRLP